MHTPLLSQKSRDERGVAIAAALWMMVAGVCVLVANAWAMGF
jgi:hypothetical protein